MAKDKKITKTYISSDKDLYPLINCVDVKAGYVEPSSIDGLFTFTGISRGSVYEELIKKPAFEALLKFKSAEPKKSSIDKSVEDNEARMKKEAREQVVKYAADNGVEVADEMSIEDIKKATDLVVAERVDAENKEKLDALKAEAVSLGIQFNDNIGFDKLSKRVDEVKSEMLKNAELQTDEPPADFGIDEDDDPLEGNE